MRPIKLTLVTTLAGTASALLVAENSPCAQYCGNVLSTTTAADITCTDSDYASSAAGMVFETCIDCELKSSYSSGNETDLQFLLYNLRYTLSYCLFGENNTNFQSTPCATSFGCGSLEPAVDWNNLTTDTGAFDFCQDWLENKVSGCSNCLEAGSMNFMNNYITILDAACRQMPAAGSTLSVQGTPFSTIPMNVTTPSATPLYTYTPEYSAISLGGKVGIAIGGLVLILSAAGFAIVCFGRRRRRAYLKSVEARYRGHPGWPSPPVGSNTHDTGETPMSQKPLRGWDDNSPVSAGTMSDRNEKNGLFPRYFSPYSSQYNSPVSADSDGPYAAWPAMASMSDTLAAGSSASAAGQPGPSSSSRAADPGVGSSRSANYWPSGYTQEEIERMAHEHQLAQIGVAFGGSDPSLRSKNSNVSLGASDANENMMTGAYGLPQAQTDFQPAPVHGLSTSSSLSSFSASAGALWEPIKGKTRQGSDESYELREIDSNGLPVKRTAVQAAVLQHPGYGRAQKYYPPPPPPQTESPYGGLTAEDAKHGNAV